MSNFTETEVFSLIGSIQGSGAEIVAHDQESQRLFVTTGGSIEIFDMSIPSLLQKVGEIDITDLGANVNSVAVKNGLVAVAIEANIKTDPGTVAFYDVKGNFLNSVEVGALPDMLVFAPDSTNSAALSTFTFAVEDFTGNDGRVLITLKQVGADVELTATVDDTVNPGDIAGIFFHLEDETLISNLNISGSDIKDIETGSDSVINVNGINLNGRPSINLGPYDVGIQIGEKGGQDFVSSTTLTISNVTLDQFAGQSFGVRLQSVGASGSGSSKLQGIADISQSTLLVANEGEADNGINPEGSVSIINIFGQNAASVSVTNLDFNAFDSQADDLRTDGIRLFPDVVANPGTDEISVSQDLEPEYIAVTPDGTKAWVTLQENNAIAVIDLATSTIEKLIPLGRKDHSLTGNGLDASDDGVINIQNWPVEGLYLPDAITSFESNGQTYFITANEGDARDEEIRVGQTEVQLINLGGATAGTFALTFDNAGTLETTTDLDFDATAADIEAALEALTGIDHVEVEAVSGGFEIGFIGNLSNTDVELLAIADNTLIGGTTATVEVLETAYILDETVFTKALELKHEESLGRLTVSKIDGDTDGDGDYDEIVAYGGRSFTIWDHEGHLVFDSGDQIEQITAQFTETLFNADEANADEFDTRSDNKGAEPEGVTIGEVDGKTYAFIGLERSAGGVVIYDISDPTQPDFVQYLQNAPDDISPEGLSFISGADSPTGQPLLAIANEVSNTISLFSVGSPGVTPVIEDSEFTIIEHITTGTIVSQIFVIDSDDDDDDDDDNDDDDNDTDDNVKFVIINGNRDFDGDGKKAFAINNSGEIYIEDSKEVDFEFNSIFNLQVAAVNSFGLSSVANVTVNLEDTDIDFSQGSQNQNGIFLFQESTTLEFSITEVNTSFTNQILCYVIDDEDGGIFDDDGIKILPGDTNYLQTIISEQRFEFGYTSIISSVFASDNPSGLPSGFSFAEQTRSIEISGGSRLGFLLVADGTVEELRAGKNRSVFFSNSNGISAEEFQKDSFSLKFKDKDDDDIFDAVKLKVKSLPPGQAKKGIKLQRQSGLSVLDLSTETTSLDVKITVNSEAAFSNFVGFYITNEFGDVLDQNGNAIALLGDENYAQAVIQQRLDISITQSISVFNTTLQGGFILAPFLIADANPDTITDYSRVFTSFLGSNSDGSDHVRLLGDNTFGIEDQFGGGDFDYDDLIVKCEFV
ncbi:choice-of-anchor I domain-containing protein [Anabaena sp. WFMT]|uniref:choice-of-anchor I domain-containing protein n=1 Tax=Anabaena sp. WFMT TaxID=3449730 RepID=UPI003F258C1E